MFGREEEPIGERTGTRGENCTLFAVLVMCHLPKARSVGTQNVTRIPMARTREQYNTRTEAKEPAV